MAKLRNRRQKTVTVVLAGVLALTGGGVAYAYWTATGTGTGTATTGESTALVVTSDPPAGVLAPGSAGQTVAFHVNNPGPGVQSFTTVTVTLADETGTAWVPPTGCLIADYAVSITTAAPAGPIAVDGSADGVATVTLANTGQNQDACQGADVPLYFQVDPIVN